MWFRSGFGRALGLFLACFLAFGRTAAAAPTPGPETKAAAESKKKAKPHFEKARAAYRNGQYREAVAELEKAIEIDPSGKDLHFNLGLVYEKLGEVDLAITSYKRYTELETDTQELEKTIQTIRRLEGAREELKRKEEPTVVPETQAQPTPERETIVVHEPAAEKPKKGRLDAWVYGAGGVAVAAALAGTYFGFRALSTKPKSTDATGNGTTIYDLQDRADRAHSYAVTADICFGVSAVAAGAGLLLYFVRDAKPTTGLRADVRATARGGELSLGAAF
jgi:tetratricopeptide (TPR) repeat protein